MQWQTNNAAQTSAPSVTAWWAGLPIGTRFVFGLNALVYLGGLCVPKDWVVSSDLAPQHFCMWPRVIWAKPSEWYRVFTSAFVHGGLMHIGFNMFNFVVSGPNLEYRIGTLCLLNLILALVAVLGALDMIIAYGGLYTNYPQFWNECSVGFSGVIFALITAESLTVPADTQYSIFGVPVPARWYPWAMLVFTQLIMPNVSLIGHLVGILGAYLWRLGVLNPLLLPSAFFIWVEITLPFKILRHPAWQRVTEEGGWRSGAGVVGNGIATGTSRAFAIGGLRMWGAALYFCGAVQTSVCKSCAGCVFWRRGNAPESEDATTCIHTLSLPTSHSISLSLSLSLACSLHLSLSLPLPLPLPLPLSLSLSVCLFVCLSLPPSLPPPPSLFLLCMHVCLHYSHAYANTNANHR
jgi:membrane associated rhomboid family serine protease